MLDRCLDELQCPLVVSEVVSVVPTEGEILLSSSAASEIARLHKSASTVTKTKMWDHSWHPRKPANIKILYIVSE